MAQQHSVTDDIEFVDDDTLAIELTELEEQESNGTLGKLASRLTLVRAEFERRHGDHVREAAHQNAAARAESIVQNFREMHGLNGAEKSA